MEEEEGGEWVLRRPLSPLLTDVKFRLYQVSLTSTAPHPDAWVEKANVQGSEGEQPSLSNAFERTTAYSNENPKAFG